MKIKNVFNLIIVSSLLLTACEYWEPNIPKGENSLREQIDGTWNIKAYILSNGKQEPIVRDTPPIMTFGKIHNDSCEINLHYVNYLQTMCILGENNQITFLDKWSGTEIYDMSCQEDMFLDILNKINSGFVRNDSLFLITDSQKELKYKAICFTR